MKVALVSQPGLFADGLTLLLEGLGDGTEVRQWSPDQPLRPSRRLHLLVIDLDGLEEDPANVVRALRGKVAAPIVAVAASADRDLMTSVLEAGATAYITKAFGREQALEIMRRALKGGCASSGASTGARMRRSNRLRAYLPYGLTRQEMHVLAHLCEGHTNLGIAKRLDVKESTVKVHVHSLYRKLGVQNRTQAARIGERIEMVRKVQLDQVKNGASVLDWLVPHMTDESHRKGEILFRKGDSGQALYYIHKGQVALEEIGEVAGEGELLGEIGIFAPEHARTCTARCATDTVLFRLTADQARRLYIENPQFAYHVVQLIAQRVTKDRLPNGLVVSKPAHHDGAAQGPTSAKGRAQ